MLWDFLPRFNRQFGVPDHVAKCNGDMVGGSIPACAGKLPPDTATAVIERSIPACAGEPPSLTLVALTIKVYPRVVRGNPYDLTRHTGSGMGLSPRVRGNRADDGDRLHYLRSIPACAGEPSAGRTTGTA